MSDVIPAEDRPHRVSALTGVDPDEQPGGIDPANRAQGAGRPDDDDHAARVAESQEATAAAAAAARGGNADAPAGGVDYSYTAEDVPATASDVVAWVRAAETPGDRDQRVAAARAVEDARDDGPRVTVTDELDR